MKPDKLALYAFLICITIALVFYFIGRSRKKNELVNNLPQETDWGKELNETQSNRVANITEALYKNMKGLNISIIRNEEPYNDLNGLNDREFVAVANYFKDKYKENLIVWLKNENFRWSSFSLQGKVNNIIARYQNLNIF